MPKNEAAVYDLLLEIRDILKSIRANQHAESSIKIMQSMGMLPSKDVADDDDDDDDDVINPNTDAVNHPNDAANAVNGECGHSRPTTKKRSHANANDDQEEQPAQPAQKRGPGRPRKNPVESITETPPPPAKFKHTDKHKQKSSEYFELPIPKIE